MRIQISKRVCAIARSRKTLTSIYNGLFWREAAMCVYVRLLLCCWVLCSMCISASSSCRALTYVHTNTDRKSNGYKGRARVSVAEGSGFCTRILYTLQILLRIYMRHNTPYMCVHFQAYAWRCLPFWHTTSSARYSSASLVRLQHISRAQINNSNSNSTLYLRSVQILLACALMAVCVCVWSRMG